MGTLPRLDRLAFAGALGVLALAAISFVVERNGAATIMCAMCLSGLVGGRIVGVPGKVLLAVALGLVSVLALIWIGSPVGWRKTSAIAHALGGGLAGWALVEGLQRRIRNPLVVALLALSAVVALSLVWELGEYTGDRLFGTSLQPRLGDSVEDLIFGTAGGAAGITLGLIGSLGRRADRHDR